MMNNDVTPKFDDTQLEDMYRQMAMLKKKLEQQQIVNDRIIRQSMKRTVSSLNRRCYILTAVSVLMLPYSYWVFVDMCEFSVVFWIATCVYMLACGGSNFYNGRDLRNDHLMKEDLLEVSRKMARAKNFNSKSLLYSIPGLLLWLVWFGWEVWQKDNSKEITAFFYGGMIGGIVGAIIGMKVHLKTQHQYQEIIDQIDDLTKE